MPRESEKSIGLSKEAIRRAIAKSGISRKAVSARCEKLAAQCGFTFGPQYLDQLLSTRGNPSRAENWRAHILAAAIGCPLEDLFQLRKVKLMQDSSLPFRWGTSFVEMLGKEVLRSTRTWISYTRCAWTHIFPAPMATWFTDKALRKLNMTA